MNNLFLFFVVSLLVLPGCQPLKKNHLPEDRCGFYENLALSADNARDRIKNAKKFYRCRENRPINDPCDVFYDAFTVEKSREMGELYNNCLKEKKEAHD